MTIADSAVLITGANRGIGRALVDEALQRGADRVYAATRRPFTHSDQRVTSLIVDVTSRAQIHAAVERVESLDILINNAGFGVFDDFTDSAVLEQHLAVNVLGTHGVTQAFLPLLSDSGGAIVNVLSIAGLAGLPVMPAYSVSKAAELSLSQSFRALLVGQGVKVHVVLAGPVDTEMTCDIQVEKASPESVAQAIFVGVEAGEEDIFPDDWSALLSDAWNAGLSKELERQFAMDVAPAQDEHQPAVPPVVGE
jgi:NAD(P)-dependent dehydrogenase (short-subunit alcohol dehydrogenase family)